MRPVQKFGGIAYYVIAMKALAYGDRDKAQRISQWYANHAPLLDHLTIGAKRLPTAWNATSSGQTGYAMSHRPSHRTSSSFPLDRKRCETPHTHTLPLVFCSDGDVKYLHQQNDTSE